MSNTKDISAMTRAASPSDDASRDLSSMLVRYADLRPCTTAFIDTRTPGSAEKENFTIIGPGVAENPEQHVHISIPHGFNIGGARQPPGCLNSQHSHETAEVFVVHSGKWAFLLGPNKEDGEVVLGPGDVISIPVHVFRGFRNVGGETGFLYAVLGGDDPGHVTWAPEVFDSAEEHGLVLIEDGSLVDTTRGETIPEGKKAMRPTTAEDVARLRRISAEEMSGCVLLHSELANNDMPETAIIGAASPQEKLAAGKMTWPHGFNLRYVTLAPGAESKSHLRREEQVIFVHKGTLTVRLPDQELEMAPGDTLTVPIGMERSFINRSNSVVETYVVHGGDSPKASEITTD
jgi:mannose-6-phosphate isomerase-like protein (cupin superfamily)